MNSFEVVPEEAYPGMYRVKYPDGVLSADFYNFDRANDHRQVLESNARRTVNQKGREMPLEARGCV